MTEVLRYHCDGCGKFINKNEVVIRRDKFSGKKVHYCHDCYKDINEGAKVYTQKSLKVFN